MLFLLTVLLLSPPDWDSWLAKSTLVSDKKAYVHILWNAQDRKADLAGSGRSAFLAEGACQVVLRRYPKTATADLVKVDVVLIREKDSYGEPKWDTMEKVAHFEASRRRIQDAAASGLPKTATALLGLFGKAEIR